MAERNGSAEAVGILNRAPVADGCLEWLSSQGKPEAGVHYSKNMPDIESLMQEWPPQVEELLPSIRLPDNSLVGPSPLQHRCSCQGEVLKRLQPFQKNSDTWGLLPYSDGFCVILMKQPQHERAAVL